MVTVPGDANSCPGGHLQPAAQWANQLTLVGHLAATPTIVDSHGRGQLRPRPTKANEAPIVCRSAGRVECNILVYSSNA